MKTDDIHNNSQSENQKQNPDRTIVMPSETANPDRTIVMPSEAANPDRTVVLPAENANPDRTVMLSDFAATKNASSTSAHFDDEAPVRAHGLKNFFRQCFPRSTGPKIDVDEVIGKTGMKAPEPVTIDTTDVSAQYKDAETRYSRQQNIARGKRITLYKCKDEVLGRSVAMGIPDEAFMLDETSRITTIREAEVCAQLDHPSILPVYGIYTDFCGNINVANKILDGMILQLYLEQISAHYRTDGMDPDEESKSLRSRLQTLLEICNGIEYAHSRNIMHGNLSSRRIFIGEYHEIYIAGWSMARHIVNNPPDPVTLENQEGTPFTAPEFFDENPQVDTRSDVYSLGMLMYELVTLRSPFDDLTQDEIRRKLAAKELPPIEHRFRYHLDSDLRAMIQKAIAINPAERYKSVEQLSSDVRRYLALEPVSLKKQSFSARYTRFILKHQYTIVSLIPVILIGIAVLVAATFWLSSRRTEQKHLNEQITFNAFASCSRLMNTLSEQLELLQLELRLTAHDIEQVLAAPDGNSGTEGDVLPDNVKYSGLEADFSQFEELPADMKYDAALLKKLQKTFTTLESSFFAINGSHYSYGSTPLFKVELVFNDGTTLCYPRTKGFNSYAMKAPSWRKAALSLCDPKIVMLEPEEVSYISNLSNFLAIPFAYPIYDARNKQIGAVVFVISNFALSSELSEADNCRGGMVAQYFAVLPEGKIIYQMLDGVPQTAGLVNDMEIEPGLLAHLNSEAGFGKEIRKESGGTFIYCWTRFNIADSSRNYIYLEKILLNSYRKMMRQEEK